MNKSLENNFLVSVSQVTENFFNYSKILFEIKNFKQFFKETNGHSATKEI
jgi:hypothetical protein